MSEIGKMVSDRSVGRINSGLSEWRKSSLGEHADIQTGPFGSQLHAADYVTTGFPSIMPTNIGNRLDIQTNNIAYIKEADAIRLARYRVEENDIVYSRRGDVEKCAIITAKESGWLCGTGCLRIRFTSNIILPKYCAYCFLTDEIKGWVSGNAVGTTMPNLNSSILRRLPLTLPPLAEQKAIAAVLSSIDAKIDLLHRQNKTLEATASTLFRLWFVEGAKPNWETVSLCDVTTKITDGAHTSPPSVDVGMPMASVKDMYQWGINTENCRLISEEDFSDLIKTDCRPLKNDILIAKDGSYLKHVFIAGEDMNVVILSSIAILRPNNKYHPILLTIFLKLESTKENLKNIVTGGVIPRIVLKDFKKFELLLPPQSIQEQALITMKPLYQKCWENDKQIHTLEKLRNNLLPKLISGEIRVSY
jgi:type I restriction enzyme S subunit